jgi:serine/threonine protein kinase
VKVIDFGSACYEGKSMYSYIQSRFYRSPEVLLGVPYNGSIDMWSLACVCSEMYLGLPLFPGVSQHNQLTRIVEMFGPPPDSLIEGRNGGKYFTKLSSIHNSKDQSRNLNNDEIDSNNTNSNSIQYRLKSAEEYAAKTNTEVPVLRKYLRYSRLDDVIIKCPLSNKNKLTSVQKREEMNKRLCFLNFLQGLFTLNPLERLTAKQASSHPFITNEPFTGSFKPPLDPKVNERKLNYLVNHHQKSSATTSVPKNTLNTSQSTSSLLSYISPNSNSNESHQHQFAPLMRCETERGDRSLPQQAITPGNSTQTSPSQSSSNQEPTGPPRLKRGQPVHIQRSPVYADSPSSLQSPSKFSSSSLSQLSQYYSALSPQQQQQQNHHYHQHQQQQYSAYSSSLHSSSMQQYQNQHQNQSQLINNNQQHLQHNQPQQQINNNQTQQINIKQQQSSSYSGAGYAGMPYAGSLGYSHHQMMQSQYLHHQLLTQQNQQQFLRSQSQGQVSPRSETTTKGTNSDTSSTSSGSNSGSTSSLSSVGTSFCEFGGSMQDNGMVMTDFGQALMRPELDERRRLQSNPYLIQQQHQQFQYMKSGNNNSPIAKSYGSHDKEGGGYMMQAALLRKQSEDKGGSNSIINSSNSNNSVDLIKSNNNNNNNNNVSVNKISSEIITSKVVNNECNKGDSNQPLSVKTASTSNNIEKDSNNNSLTNSNLQKSDKNLTINTNFNDDKLNKSSSSASNNGETDALADWDPFFNNDDRNI